MKDYDALLKVYQKLLVQNHELNERVWRTENNVEVLYQLLNKYGKKTYTRTVRAVDNSPEYY